MWVFYTLLTQPVYEVGEVVRDLLPDENPVDHVAAEQTHFYFVTHVQVDLLVFVDGFEDVGGCRTVGELQLVKTLLSDVESISLFKVFDGHVLDYILDLGICIFECKLCLELFFLQFIAILLVLLSIHAFVPSFLFNCSI